MTFVVPFEELRFSPTALLFEAGAHGIDGAISIFYVQTPPGAGPGQHVHPYAEVFLVLEGEATFRVAGEETVVAAGNVVAVPPETAHGFKNRGEGPLRVVSMHPSPRVQQTWLDED